MLTPNHVTTSLPSESNQSSDGLPQPTANAIAWAEAFLDSLSDETHAILRRPTRRMSIMTSR